MRRIGAICLVATALVSGCSMLRGFTRAGTLADGLEFACVDRALAAAEGVTVHEAHDRTDKGYEIAPERGDSSTTARWWVYSAPGVDRAVFVVSRQDKRGPLVRVGHTWGKEKKEDMAEPFAKAALGAMLKVEAEVEKTCGKPIDYKMSCGEISCKPLKAMIAGEGV